jgi:hypothetical protein
MFREYSIIPLVQAFLVEPAGHLVNVVHVDGIDHGILFHVAEQGDLFP